MKFKNCKAPIIKLHLRNKSQYNLCVTDTKHFLMKLKETYQNGGLYQVLQIGRINIAKLSDLPKLT